MGHSDISFSDNYRCDPEDRSRGKSLVSLGPARERAKANDKKGDREWKLIDKRENSVVEVIDEKRKHVNGGDGSS